MQIPVYFKLAAHLQVFLFSDLQLKVFNHHPHGNNLGTSHYLGFKVHVHLFMPWVLQFRVPLNQAACNLGVNTFSIL